MCPSTASTTSSSWAAGPAGMLAATAASRAGQLDAPHRALRLPRRRRTMGGLEHVLRTARPGARRGPARDPRVRGRAARPADRPGRAQRAAPVGRGPRHGASRSTSPRTRSPPTSSSSPAGAELLFHTSVVDVVMADDDTIDAVVIESKSGRRRARALLHRRLGRRRSRGMVWCAVRALRAPALSVAHVPDQRRRPRRGRRCVEDGATPDGGGRGRRHPQLPAQEADRAPAAQPDRVAVEPHAAEQRRRLGGRRHRCAAAHPR